MRGNLSFEGCVRLASFEVEDTQVEVGDEEVWFVSVGTLAMGTLAPRVDQVKGG